jgi:hypothetical protein
MTRVFFSSPTYGPVMPEVHDSTICAVMVGAKSGIEWAGTASPDREGWEDARNGPAAGLRDRDDIDGIIWMDSDMLVPQFAFARMVAYGKDLVSSLYFQRRPPYRPNVYGWNPRKKAFHPLWKYDDNALMPVGGFGFGCCYTSMRLIRALPRDPFKCFNLSEDLSFCRRAIEAGFQPYVDTGIKCDHYVGPRWANEKMFLRWRESLFGHKLLLGGPDGAVHDGGEEDVRRIPEDTAKPA